MWAAKIYIDDVPYEKLPTLSADGILYYPKPYNPKDQQSQLASGDSRSSGSPTPKRPRKETGATTEQ